MANKEMQEASIEVISNLKKLRMQDPNLYPAGFYSSTSMRDERGVGIKRENFGAGPKWGMELEINTRHHISEYREVFYPMRRWFAISPEGSFRPELKFRPMSFRFIREHEALLTPFKFMTDNGDTLLRETQDGAGLHVMMDTSIFSSPENYSRFVSCLYSVSNRTIVRAFSQRTKASWSMWCSRRGMPLGKGPCKRTIDDSIKEKSGFPDGRGRATPKLDHRCLEVRLFRGTPDPEEFLAKVEFLYALTKWTTKKSHDSDTLPQFTQAHANTTRYPYLSKLIQTEEGLRACV